MHFNNKATKDLKVRIKSLAKSCKQRRLYGDSFSRFLEEDRLVLSFEDVKVRDLPSLDKFNLDTPIELIFKNFSLKANYKHFEFILRLFSKLKFLLLVEDFQFTLHSNSESESKFEPNILIFFNSIQKCIIGNVRVDISCLDHLRSYQFLRKLQLSKKVYKQFNIIIYKNCSVNAFEDKLELICSSLKNNDLKAIFEVKFFLRGFYLGIYENSLNKICNLNLKISEPTSDVIANILVSSELVNKINFSISCVGTSEKLFVFLLQNRIKPKSLKLELVLSLKNDENNLIKILKNTLTVRVISDYEIETKLYGTDNTLDAKLKELFNFVEISNKLCSYKELGIGIRSPTFEELRRELQLS